MKTTIEQPKVDEAFLQEVVRRIRSVAEVDRIILFGSAATGTMTPDSDIDLLVLEANPGNVVDETVSIVTALRRMGHAFDVFVLPTQRFEETKNVVGTLAHPANKYGKIVYERAGCRFERRCSAAAG